MKNYLMKLAVIILFLSISADTGQSQIPKRKLIVGTKESPPFAMKNTDGSWSGISIELWEQIAEELGIQYELREMETLKDLLDGIKKRKLDVGVAALTITSKREKVLDFTHPYYTSGLGLAIHSKGKKAIFDSFLRFFTVTFFKAVAALAFVLLLVGFIIWFVERKRNKEHFGGGILKGIGSGFWWSAVTMTTVGYGDKAPKTFLGRLIGTIWMFAAIIVISSFTAAIASSLTVTRLESPVQGPEDLPRVFVGSVPNSTSEAYLRKKRISYRNYTTPREGLIALANNEIDTMVYDAPILRYLANTEFKGLIDVLPNVFKPQNYAIALPSGSKLQDLFNIVLLRRIDQPQWQDILYRYLGK